MNLESIWLTVWPMVGPPALQVTAILAAAGLVERRCRAASNRRALWQMALVGILLLVVLEWGNASHWINQSWRFVSEKEPSALGSIAPTSGLPSESRAVVPVKLKQTFEKKVQERLAVNRTSPSTSAPRLHPSDSNSSLNSESQKATGPSSSRFEPRETALERAEWVLEPANLGDWVLLFWILGTAAVAIRMILLRVVFFGFLKGKLGCPSEPLRQEVHAMARRLGWFRPIRLISWPRLPAPVAFGIVRPTIGIPPQFEKDFTVEQREAILAHEIAHLAGRDPLWQLLMDLAAALLWWHPMLWWARKKWQTASEAAADESSLLLRNGPAILAECLVHLGGRLVRARTFGTLGVGGHDFKSGLGQRVEQLMNLKKGEAPQPSLIRSPLAKLCVPVTLALVALAGTAWVSPQNINKGDRSMKNIANAWSRTVATLAIMTTLSPDNSGQTSPPPSRGKPKPAIQSGAELPEPLALIDANPSPSLAGQSPGSAPPGIETEVPGLNPAPASRYDLGAAPAKKPRLGMDPSLAPRQTADPFRAFSEQQRKIHDKLHEIQIQEVMFDGVPLRDVVSDLIQMSRRLDPEKEGLNFLLSNRAAPGPDRDPITGMVQAGSTANLDVIAVRIYPALRKVRLIDVLEAITKASDQPVAYSIEDYGVLFSVKAPPPNAYQHLPGTSPAPAPLVIRTFRIDPQALFENAEQVFELPGGRKNPNARDLLHEILFALGVKREKPNLIFYNTQTGSLMARASTEELDLIEAALQTLGGQSTGHQPGMGYGSAYGMPGMGMSMGGLGGGMDPGAMSHYGMGGGGIGSPSGAGGSGLGMPGALGGGLSGAGDEGFAGGELGGGSLEAAGFGAGGMPSAEAASVVSFGGGGFTIGALEEGHEEAAVTFGAGESEMAPLAVSVLGAVRKPGRFSMNSGHNLSVLEAIAMAGGFSPSANKKRIELTRDGKTSQHTFDELRHAGGAEKRLVLKPGDIIHVPEVNF